MALPPGETAVEKRVNLESTHACWLSQTGFRQRYKVSLQQKHNPQFPALSRATCFYILTVLIFSLESLGSREPTCTELLKTTDMTEEEQRSEFSSLCRFYRLTCPPGRSTTACSRMVEDKCLTRFKKCRKLPQGDGFRTLLRFLTRGFALSAVQNCVPSCRPCWTCSRGLRTTSGTRLT